MTADEGRDDDLFARVARLRTDDVSHGHTRRLRQRCHARLQAECRPDASETAIATLFRRVIGPALVGAWSVAYLAEIFRRAAAIWLLP